MAISPGKDAAFSSQKSALSESPRTKKFPLTEEEIFYMNCRAAYLTVFKSSLENIISKEQLYLGKFFFKIYVFCLICWKLIDQKDRNKNYIVETYQFLREAWAVELHYVIVPFYIFIYSSSFKIKHSMFIQTGLIFLKLSSITCLKIYLKNSCLYFKIYIILDKYIYLYKIYKIL